MQKAGPYKESPPNENEIKMIVSGRPLNQCLPYGQSVSCEDGEKIIPVLARHEKQVMDLLETEPEQIKKAEEHFKRGLHKWLAKDVKDGNVDEATKEQIERAEGTYGGSIEASFREMNGRDIKPLKTAQRVYTAEIVCAEPTNGAVKLPVIRGKQLQPGANEVDIPADFEPELERLEQENELIESARVTLREFPPQATMRAMSENTLMVKQMLEGLGPLIVKAVAAVGDSAGARAAEKVIEEFTAPGTKKKKAN